MRILNVTPSYFPFEEFGGPPAKVRALAQRMAIRKHLITVLTLDWGIKDRAKREDGGGSPVERSPFGWEKVENGIEAIYLRRWLQYGKLSWTPGAAGFCRARLSKFDVVHIFGLYDLLGPRVAAACRDRGTPYVVEPMGMFLPIVRSLRLKRMYHRWLGQKMLQEAAAIVATSAQEGAELKSAGLPENKIFLRRNGVQAPAVLPERGVFRRSLGMSEEAKLVLYLGRLSQKKSPDLLVRAFARLAVTNDGRPMYLVIAGPDEHGMKNRLTTLAADLRVGKQIQFCGALYGDAKWSAYRDADVFVLPSQNENFGNTAGEAVLAGTPVVLTDRCGIAPLLGTAAIVCRHDEGALQEAIVRVLFDDNTQIRMKAGCREASARLDWEEPARKMEQLYIQMAGSERELVAAGS